MAASGSNLRRLLISNCFVGVLVAASGAASQEAVRTYSIPSQDLGAALRAYALESGVNVIFAPEAVANRTSRPVQGEMNERQALDQMLAGSGLVADVSGPGTIVVRPAPAAPPARPARNPTSAKDGASDGPSSSQIEEVVVTARKVSEDLQTTPVAVTAVSPAQLEIKQIEEITDLTRAAPNFTALGAGTSGGGVGSYSIRGQSQANLTSGNDVPVALYIDGVYYARAQTNNGAMVDMASAEVLRGPQGTLFGRNTTGGALNLTTKAPTDIFEGSLKLGYGRFDNYTAEGVVNIPLGDELAARFVGSYEQHDGYAFNANTNEREADLENYFGRVSVQWAPESMPLTLRITGDYARRRDHGTPAKVNLVDPAGALGGLGTLIKSLPGGFYTTYSGVTAPGSFTNLNLGFPAGFGASGHSGIDIPGSSVKTKGILANLEVELGEVQLKSITAFRKNFSSNSWDLDGTPANGLSVVANYHQKQFSQELQLTGSAGALDWIAGLYFFRETAQERTDSWQFVSFASDPAQFTSISKGVFAQGVYHLTDKLRATAGLRYTWDKRSADLQGVFGGVQPDYSDALCGVGANLGLPAGPNCDESRSATFDYPAWLASLDYQITPDLFTYIKTSGASMAGGVNFRYVLTPADRQFGPEDVRDVEWGLKADLLDRRLRTNLAAFYIWRSGLQANVLPFVPLRGVTQYQVNAGKAHQYGLEFEATAKPWTGMEISGSAAYLHSEYVKGSFVLLGVDHSDEAVTFAPKYTWSVGATQNVPTDFGDLSLHADYSYYSTYYYTPDATNAVSNRAGAVPGRGLLNGRIALTLDDPDIEFSVWGRNLAGKKYFTTVFNSIYAPLGISSAALGAPRTYGATVAYKW